MKFTELEDTVPYVLGKKLHAVTMNPYPGVTLAMPGRHQKDTPVPGGDFVVKASDHGFGWRNHPFTHVDIFKDVEQKFQKDPVNANVFVDAYAQVVFGADPNDFEHAFDGMDSLGDGSLTPGIFLKSSQCLALAEHRRYAKFESRGGGRFLPLRFALGITSGLWTAADCATWQRKGRPGLEALISIHGDIPALTTWTSV